MDRIIDFNDLKNRVKEEDLDKFESYMYSLYYKMAEGKLSMSDLTKEMLSYAEKNNISQDKFLKMQTKIMERYGFDASNLEGELKKFGIDNINPSAISTDYESARRTMSFQEKYKTRLESKLYSTYYIKNEKNNVKILLESINVIIMSESTVDLTDNELNEFLCSYKKVNDDNTLNISICNNSSNYEY